MLGANPDDPDERRLTDTVYFSKKINEIKQTIIVVILFETNHAEMQRI